MIHHVLVGSILLMIGKVISLGSGVAFTLSGLGGGGCGFGFSVGGIDGGGAVFSLERLLLKVINDGAISCLLEFFYIFSLIRAGIEVLSPSRLRFDSGLETYCTRCMYSLLTLSVCYFAPTVEVRNACLTLRPWAVCRSMYIMKP